jgi:hypothetical protein
MEADGMKQKLKEAQSKPECHCYDNGSVTVLAHTYAGS